jgi:prepilin-type N-terminal cleavage/methylation domain-containing protein
MVVICVHKTKGFTIIELLIVVMLVGMVLSIALPVSYGMYESYNASLRTQEVMIYISEVRRNAFLYSERKVLSARNGHLTVDDREKVFSGIHVHLSEPIVFFQNGTTTGGVLILKSGAVIQRLVVQAPLGDISLKREGR